MLEIGTVRRPTRRAVDRPLAPAGWSGRRRALCNSAGDGPPGYCLRRGRRLRRIASRSTSRLQALCRGGPEVEGRGARIRIGAAAPARSPQERCKPPYVHTVPCAVGPFALRLFRTCRRRSAARLARVVLRTDGSLAAIREPREAGNRAVLALHAATERFGGI